MLVDILVTAFIFAIQGVLAWFGVYVSVPERRVRNGIILIGGGLVVAGLSCVLVYRSSRAQQELQSEITQIKRNTEADPLKRQIQDVIDEISGFKEEIEKGPDTTQPMDGDQQRTFSTKTAKRYYERFSPILNDIVDQLEKCKDPQDAKAAKAIRESLKNYEGEGKLMDTGTIEQETDRFRKLLPSVR